jgi:hypothetical protein
MFQQIVSKLSLSPSAVSELAFYARRLKQESITRTFSAIAAVLIVGLQFAVISAPPAPTNAASPNDIIYGGFVSKADLLNRYDSSAELQALFKHFGISRADLQQSDTTTINSRDHSLKSIGRTRHLSSDDDIKVGSRTYYARGLYTWDTGANVQKGSSYKVLRGTRSSDGGYFAVMFHCGNIVFKQLPPKPTPPPPPPPTPTPTPKPTPTPTKPTLACVELIGDVKTGQVPLTVTYTGRGQATGQTISQYQFNFGDGKTANQASSKVAHQYTTPGKFTATLKVKGSKGSVSPAISACSFTVNVTTPPAAFTRAKTALNVSQSIDATTAPAHAGDTIRYTLSTKNTGGTAEAYTVVEHVEDVLEYADITDPTGAKLENGVLTWPAKTITPGSVLSTTFTVRIKSPIPATPVGVSDKFSYDLRMDNVYGNDVHINLEAPLAKQVESASTSLPDTGGATSTLIVLLVSGLSLFFYFRNRQLITEIKLLRGTYQGGL